MIEYFLPHNLITYATYVSLSTNTFSFTTDANTLYHQARIQQIEANLVDVLLPTSKSQIRDLTSPVWSDLAKFWHLC